MGSRIAFAIVLSLVATGCSGGGSGSSAPKTSDNGTLATPAPSPAPAPLPQPIPTTLPPVPTISLDQGITATADRLISIAIDKPGMLQMKISFDKDCSGGTWEPFSNTRSIELSDNQLNRPVDVSVMFIDVEQFKTACYTTSILHDNIPPTVVVDHTIPAITNNVQQTVSFHGEDSGAGVSNLFCVMPGQTAATPCSGLYDGHLSDGAYVVKLLASDGAGNISAPTTVSFTVDTTAPTITLNSMPPALTAATSGKFEFSGNDNLTGVDHFECKIDGGSYNRCVSGQNFDSLTQGSHVVDIRSVDGAGNSSPVAEYKWNVDSTAPSIRFTQTPARVTNLASATFDFVGTESDGTAISNFECRIDGGAFASCTGPRWFNGLSEGTHSFGVRGTSRAGVVSSVLTYTWNIDLTAPVINITKAPGTLGNSTSATFTFTATDSSSGMNTVMCSIDGAANKDCASLVQSYSGLTGNQSHSFTITATDQAGNQVVSAPYTWYIDVTAPTVKIVSTPPAVTSSTQATFRISGTDDHGPVNFQCKLDGDAVFSNCNQTITYNYVGDGTHTISVISVDSAGNQSVPSTYTWVVDTVGPVINFTKTPNDTIYTIDHGTLAYTVTDPVSLVVSANCALDGVAISCQLPSGTLTFPTLTVGPHTFALSATNAAGVSSTRTFSFNVQPYCSTTLSSTTLPTKMLFITDMSGSNQSAPGCALGPDCTDEGKKMRAGSIQKFFSDYGSNANFSWAFNIFQGSVSAALINSGLPTAPIFSNSYAMQSAINYFKGITDAGGTPYMASLTLATTLIANDPDLKSTSKPQYIIVFLSDGMPNGSGDTALNIINQIKAIMALAPGRISFNSVYYGPVNKTASDLLQAMATTGNGNFLNTNTNPTGLSFSISDLVNVPVTSCQ